MKDTDDVYLSSDHQLSSLNIKKYTSSIIIDV